ncbi:MAG: DUF5723 family protein [Vicingaceae bacterium]
MKIIFYFLLSFSFSVGFAQQDFTIYNMQEIPQSNYNNPSNRFNGSFYIGLPAISSTYMSFSNSDFAYSDAIKKVGDSLNVDFQNILDMVNNDNYLSFNTRVDLLSFGISISPTTQFTFNMTENLNFRMNYTKDFIELIYKGNAGFDDNTANFEGIGLSLNHYREYAFGISHQLNDQLRIGGKLKYLYGMENIYSERTDISLVTDPETFELTFLADISIKTSGINNFDENNEGGRDYFFNRGNRGFAVDLGANYELNDKLSLNASILDLGAIRWSNNTISYSNNGEEFVYNGIELDAFAEDDEQSATNDGETSFDRVLDSLEKSLAIDTTYDSYTAPITSRFYIGANYKLNEQSMVGGLIQSEVFQRKIIPSITLSYNRKVSNIFSVAGSYTIINGSYTNLGLGVNFNPGPVQFYAVTDNIFGVFRPQHNRHIQVRFGLNFIFGANKTKELNPAYRRKESSPTPSKSASD